MWQEHLWKLTYENLDYLIVANSKQDAITAFISDYDDMGCGLCEDEKIKVIAIPVTDRKVSCGPYRIEEVPTG